MGFDNESGNDDEDKEEKHEIVSNHQNGLNSFFLKKLNIKG